jgi:predicted O-methyltransferase YrrM
MKVIGDRFAFILSQAPHKQPFFGPFAEDNEEKEKMKEMRHVGLQDVLGLARSFMECRVFLSAAELDLFTLLTPAALPAREVAGRLGAETRGLTILLDALSAMGLLDKQGELYQCSFPASRFLSADAPDSVLPMVLHMAGLWRRWSGLTSIVRRAQVSDQVTASFRDVDELSAFIGAMDVIAKPLAARIVADVHHGPSRALLDVGGASGTYTIAFLQAAPEMKATLFDKPEVIEIARRHLQKAGILDRVSLVPGDFYRDQLPAGHDLAFISAIIHQNSPEQNVSLFRNVFRSLNRGGRVVIRDHVMEPDRTRPKEGALFAVNMLVSTPAGRTYTYDEIKACLEQAGFIEVRLLQKGEHMDALVEAFKP